MLLVTSPALREGWRTVSKAEGYLDRNKTFAAAAEVAAEPGRKVRLLEMAQYWAHVAEIAKRNALLPSRHGYDNPALCGDGGRNGAE